MEYDKNKILTIGSLLIIFLIGSFFLWEAPQKKEEHEEDMDYIKIAETLSLPLGTVKAHLFRARKILYASLKNQKHLFY